MVQTDDSDGYVRLEHLHDDEYEPSQPPEGRSLGVALLRKTDETHMGLVQWPIIYANVC